jgi:hypothetical protein
MLVAIVPHEDAAWFFKLVARGDEIEPLRKPFEEFVSSIDVGEKGEKPKWTLPAGWQEKPGGEMRAATIEVPHEGKKLELTVTTLPQSGDWDAYLTRNVNRWLGQLQQGDLAEKTVKGLTKSLPYKDGEATYVELVGVMQATPVMLPPGHPSTGAQSPATASTAGGEQPSSTAPAAARPPMGGAIMPAGEFAKPAEFTYIPPAGWQPGQINMMRKAAFVIADGDKQAGVTVTQFPANAAMSDPTAQAQRWAGEAGLQPSQQALKAAAKDVTIDGIEGQQFELLGPADGAAPKGVLAAMVRRGERMWFFKMSGDRTVVEKQGEAFAEFLKSIKFRGDAG